jgi:hypothetical protein
MNRNRPPARPARRRRLRRAVAAVLTLTGLAGGALMLAAPSGAGLSPDVRVIDSHASAAAVGVLSRVPAESDGGAVYSSTALTVDKTQAQAAGFTAGELAELFFESSSDKYRNPTLVRAQYPPAGTVPAESSFDGAAAPQGAPAAAGAGHLHAVAAGAPSAAAEAAGAQATLGDVTVGGATSVSSGDLGADGTLITKARSAATDVSIAGVLTLAAANTVAEARVPRTGPPTTTLQVKLAGVALAGVPAEITPDGIRISDKAAASPVTIAEFNAALAQLQAKGITVVAAPLVQETAAGVASASGGGLTIRYKVADQIGGDEELTLAPASARSAVARREIDAPTVDVPVPSPAADGPAPGAGAAAASPASPVGSGIPALTGSGSGSAAGGLPGVSYGFDSDRLSGAAAALGGPSSAVPYSASAGAPNATTSAVSGASNAATSAVSGASNAATSAAAAAVPSAHHGPDPARRLRSGYALVLLAALAGVAAVTAQFRIRPA